MDWKMAQVTGLMLATTIGAGIFALPYVFSAAGIFLSLAYLIALAFTVKFAHELYFRMLQEENGEVRLVGMIAKRLGQGFRIPALLIVGGGLMLTLVAYLILGADFLRTLSPALGIWADPLFWAIAAAPILLRLPRIFILEFGGAVVITFLILMVAGVGFPYADIDVHLWGEGQWFLPFGIILFALAAWPAVEPIFEESKASGLSREETLRAMKRGTYISALLYAVFALGIVGASVVVPQEVTELLSAWPLWLQASLVLFGLFAIWTSYAPVALTLINSFTFDLGWSRPFSMGIVILLPLALVLLGFKNFFAAASLVGGVFLAGEYVLLLLASRRTLLLSLWDLILVNTLTALFLCAGLYELYYFVVQ
jgi:amino acid permease